MSKTAAKRKAGRPPKPEAEKFNTVTIRLPKDMIQDIDQLRDHRRDRPDRSAQIRELLAKALTAGE